MAWLVVECLKIKDLGENYADAAWLASQLKAFQKDLGANDADAWLGVLLKAFQKDLGVNRSIMACLVVYHIAVHCTFHDFTLHSVMFYCDVTLFCYFISSHFTSESDHVVLYCSFCIK